MNGSAVPVALREKLGPEATGGLLEVLEAAHQEWRDDVIAVCAERFERRLVEETSKLRVAIVEGDAGLRQEMTVMGASLRQEMAAMGSSIRQEIAAMGSSLRQEIAAMGGDLRREISDGRLELLKWCFLFWMGQVVAVAGIMGLMLRLSRP